MSKDASSCNVEIGARVYAEKDNNQDWSWASVLTAVSTHGNKGNSSSYSVGFLENRKGIQYIYIYIRDSISLLTFTFIGHV